MNEIKRCPICGSESIVDSAFRFCIRCASDRALKAETIALDELASTRVDVAEKRAEIADEQSATVHEPDDRRDPRAATSAASSTNTLDFPFPFHEMAYDRDLDSIHAVRNLVSVEFAKRYRILGEIGRGGMGVVFEGLDVVLNRKIAIKILRHIHRDISSVVDRMIAEARICCRLEHRGIVTVLDLGRLLDARPFFTMKLVAGRTLSCLLAERSDSGDRLRHFLSIFEDITKIIAYAHSYNVIHRDLKPANVMLDSVGEVQVMDWGLAKPLSSSDSSIVLSSGTVVGQILGSPAYMSPEQARGEIDCVDERSDVFGLGAILCEILTGCAPFGSGKGGESLRKALLGDVADAFDRLDRCGCDSALIEIAKKCLAIDQSDRFENAKLVGEAIAAYRSEESSRLAQSRIDQVVGEAIEEKIRHEADSHFNLGLVLKNKGRIDKAIDEFQVAIRLNPNLAEARVGLGNAYQETGLVEEAVVEYRNAIRLKPDYIGARIILGYVLNNLKRYNESLDELRAAIALDESSSEAHLALGSTLKSLRRYDEAISEFHIAIQIHPQFAEARLALGNALKGKRLYQDAAAQYREAIRIKPNLAEAHLALGKILGRLGDDSAAVAEFRIAVLIKPELAEAHLALGNAFKANGRSDDAIVEFRTAIRFKPASVEARIALAIALSDKGLLDDAIAEYREAIRIKPELSSAHRLLGDALSETGKIDEAIESYRESIRLDADDPEAHCNLGLALQKIGMFVEALKSLEQGDELARRRGGRNFRTKQWIDDCKRLVALKNDPTVYTEDYKNKNSRDLILSARMFAYLNKHYMSYRLYSAAFGADRSAGGQLEESNRYAAACAAVKAAADRTSGDHADESTRDRLLNQAIDWLEVDLNQTIKTFDSAAPAKKAMLFRKMRHWLIDPDLAGVREAQAVETLTEVERSRLSNLWTRVEKIMRKQ